MSAREYCIGRGTYSLTQSAFKCWALSSKFPPPQKYIWEEKLCFGRNQNKTILIRIDDIASDAFVARKLDVACYVNKYMPWICSRTLTHPRPPLLLFGIHALCLYTKRRSAQANTRGRIFQREKEFMRLLETEGGSSVLETTLEQWSRWCLAYLYSVVTIHSSSLGEPIIFEVCLIACTSQLF